MKSRSSAIMAVAALAMATISHAQATSFVDPQANNPQVQGQPDSNITAVFPTNKQNEPTIAVNPADSSIVLAGANDEQRQPPCGPGPVRGPTAPANDCSFFADVGTSGIYRSLDGGQTWSNLGLLDDQASWRSADLVSDGDPVIVWGPKPDAAGFSYTNGARAYYATLASYKQNNGPYPPGKAPEYLALSYSDDNGATWTAPVLITTKNNPNDFNDKESMWVDALPSSPYFGRIYVSYTEFRSATATGNGSEPIMVAISTDGGTSFGSPKQLSPAGNNGTGNGRQGSAVRTGPDGSVYVAWIQGSAQVLSISRDGGQKWSRPSAIGAVTDIADPIPGANFRTNSFLSIAVDPGAATKIYAAWATRTPGGGRIVVAASRDQGVSWSAPVEVSSEAQGYAFFQGLDVAPNGRVDVAFQALVTGNPGSFGVGNASIDSYYASYSNDTWSTPVKVSSASSDPSASAQNNLLRQFWGDYNTLESTNEVVWFVYTDSRNGAGCAAVDEYQRGAIAANAVSGDMADRISARLGQTPATHNPGGKPAPQEHCPSQFGNTDIVVSRITP